ncbi:MAG: glycosyltransferase [Thermodesulfovibrionales bacterium]|nr:glycosyltransferase [Thermodesulfovibrionales bacterium]
MKVSGFTFIRNAVKLGYPVTQSIKSVLPICDEFIVNIGDSEDGTLSLIESLKEPKVRIVSSKWNENMRVKGFVYGQQKTIAHYNCTGDWAFYIEADEVVHEDDIPRIYDSMKRHLDNPSVEALVFDYIHFYGNHATCLDSPGWYRRAPRVIRNTLRAYSPDGLFFVVLEGNKKGRYPNAALANAKMYHYGWVRSEEQMNEKSRRVSKYWGAEPLEISYLDIDPSVLKEFRGSHPAVIKGWLPAVPVPFTVNKGYRLTPRDRRHGWMKKMEGILGIDLSKKHFRLIEG